MNATRHFLAAAVLAAAPLPPALALQRGEMADGAAYVCGGIGQEEIRALHAERGRYSLWVATVAKGSGAYLSDATLRIARLDGKAPPFEQVMDGPWCFAALPLGRYKVSATLPTDAAAAAQTMESQVTVHPGDHHQVVFRFAVQAEVAPEREPLFKGNPFGAGPDAK